eukprot:364555-Chlamydomonas_euryale.AAC.10
MQALQGLGGSSISWPRGHGNAPMPFLVPFFPVRHPILRSQTSEHVCGRASVCMRGSACIASWLHSLVHARISTRRLMASLSFSSAPKPRTDSQLREIRVGSSVSLDAFALPGWPPGTSLLPGSIYFPVPLQASRLAATDARPLKCTVPLQASSLTTPDAGAVKSTFLSLWKHPALQHLMQDPCNRPQQALVHDNDAAHAPTHRQGTMPTAQQAGQPPCRQCAIRGTTVQAARHAGSVPCKTSAMHGEGHDDKGKKGHANKSPCRQRHADTAPCRHSAKKTQR